MLIAHFSDKASYEQDHHPFQRRQGELYQLLVFAEISKNCLSRFAECITGC